MRPLAPYAGYDPTERQFYHLSHLERKESFLRRFGRRQQEIDAARALVLKSEGMTWRAIGQLLAFETGRSVVYNADSVKQAADRITRKANDNASTRLDTDGARQGAG